MPVLVSSGGSLIGVGQDRQPFPKYSAPFGAFTGDGVQGGVPLLANGRTISYANIYRTQVWVAIAANKLQRSVVRLPLKLYKAGADGARERVRSGILADLMGAPFAGAGPGHLKQAVMLSMLIHGNAVVRKVRDRPGQPPNRLEPLLWTLMSAHGPLGGPVELWETAQAGHPQWIDPGDIIHFAWRGADGPVGVSPLRQLGTTVSIEDAAQRYQQALFTNGGRPPSAIEASEEFLSLDPEERALMMGNLRADVKAVYGSPEAAGLPAILPPGLKWNAIGHTPVEAELIQQREITREEIAAVYDVPPPLIGILKRASFNNITELHRMLYVTVLGPWLSLIEETFQAQLIRPEPSFSGKMWMEFDLSEVLKGDLLARSQALALQIGCGVLTIDEAREIENRRPFNLPETSLPLYPANNLTPAGREPNPVGGASNGNGSAAQAADIKQAAQAFAEMGPADVQRLLARSGGSVVNAIFDLAGVSATNGHLVPEVADDGDLDDED